MNLVMLRLTMRAGHRPVGQVDQGRLLLNLTDIESVIERSDGVKIRTRSGVDYFVEQDLDDITARMQNIFNKVNGAEL